MFPNGLSPLGFGKPDHSFLKGTIDFFHEVPINYVRKMPSAQGLKRTIYKVDNIPDDFIMNDTTFEKIQNAIQYLNRTGQHQNELDKPMINL